jgi:hypothetical protein
MTPESAVPAGLLHILHTCDNPNGEAIAEGKYTLLFPACPA